VEEDRLEIVVPRRHVEAAVEALVDAHPYEEVAYDLYPLAGGASLGIGRLTRPKEPMRAGDLVERCRDRLGATVRMAGDRTREIRAVAVCGGSGAAYIPAAIAAGADAYVTGDVKHHDALDAVAAGLVVIDAGRHGTEWPFVPHLADRLRDAGLGDVLVSETPTDPFATP
ncbi:MAG: Nif3-like dinuclear metal center hexameric protein, partial [Actinomycetota bacterium]